MDTPAEKSSTLPENKHYDIDEETYVFSKSNSPEFQPDGELMYLTARLSLTSAVENNKTHTHIGKQNQPTVHSYKTQTFETRCSPTFSHVSFEDMESQNILYHGNSPTSSVNLNENKSPSPNQTMTYKDHYKAFFMDYSDTNEYDWNSLGNSLSEKNVVEYDVKSTKSDQATQKLSSNNPVKWDIQSQINSDKERSYFHEHNTSQWLDYITSRQSVEAKDEAQMSLNVSNSFSQRDEPHECSSSKDINHVHSAIDYVVEAKTRSISKPTVKLQKTMCPPAVKKSKENKTKSKQHLAIKINTGNQMDNVNHHVSAVASTKRSVAINTENTNCTSEEDECAYIDLKNTKMQDNDSSCRSTSKLRSSNYTRKKERRQHADRNVDQNPSQTSKCFFVDSSHLDIIKLRDPTKVKLRAKKFKSKAAGTEVDLIDPPSIPCSQQDYCATPIASPVNSSSGYGSEKVLDKSYVAKNKHIRPIVKSYTDKHELPNLNHTFSHNETIHNRLKPMYAETEHAERNTVPLKYGSKISGITANDTTDPFNTYSLKQHSSRSKGQCLARARYPLHFHTDPFHKILKTKQNKVPSSFCAPSKYGKEARIQTEQTKMNRRVHWRKCPLYSSHVRHVGTGCEILKHVGKSDASVQHVPQLISYGIQVQANTKDSSAQHEIQFESKQVGTDCKNYAETGIPCQPKTRSRMVETIYNITDNDVASNCKPCTGELFGILPCKCRPDSDKKYHKYTSLTSSEDILQSSSLAETEYTEDILSYESDFSEESI